MWSQSLMLPSWRVCLLCLDSPIQLVRCLCPFCSLPTTAAAMPSPTHLPLTQPTRSMPSPLIALSLAAPAQPISPPASPATHPSLPYPRSTSGVTPASVPLGVSKESTSIAASVSPATPAVRPASSTGYPHPHPILMGQQIPASVVPPTTTC